MSSSLQIFHKNSYFGYFKIIYIVLWVYNTYNQKKKKEGFRSVKYKFAICERNLFSQSLQLRFKKSVY